MLIAWAIVFATRGVTTLNEDKLARLTVSGIWVGGGVLYAVAFHLTRSGKSIGRVFTDERDRAIMASAVQWQLAAVIFGLVAWVIALTEVYWDRGAVPIVFPNLIIMSELGLMLLAQAAGVLIGYRRMGGDAAR
jgi:hypothetical protein